MGGPETVISTKDLEQGQSRSGNHGKHQYEMREVPWSEYYNKIVDPNLQQRPWLDILHQFLNPDVEGFAVEQDNRMRHFDIKVIHISKSGNIDSLTICTTPTMFKEAISEDKERSGTLIIAKGLSRAMIDALGMQYELEPELFASHLGGTESFRMGYWESPTLRAPARAPNLLPDYLRKSPFYTAEYRRPYHIKDGIKEIFELRSTKTTTPRGAQVLNNELPDAFVFEKISVYKKKNSNIGIILTDQLLSKVPPASHILSPVTFLDDNPGTLGNDGRLCQVSSRRELIGWLQRLTPEEAKALFDDQEPLALRPVLKIVERSSAMFLVHARHIMTRIATRHCDEKFPNSIPFFLNISRALHRHIHDQQRLLRYALRVASLKGGENITEQIRDFGFLTEDMDGALKALEEDVRFLVSAASIREGKIVGWVSKFAALFLPVSLLATILSISDPGYIRWAILGGLSVPFVLITICFMFLWKPAYLDNLGF